MWCHGCGDPWPLHAAARSLAVIVAIVPDEEFLAGINSSGDLQDGPVFLLGPPRVVIGTMVVYQGKGTQHHVGLAIGAVVHLDDGKCLPLL